MFQNFNKGNIVICFGTENVATNKNQNKQSKMNKNFQGNIFVINKLNHKGLISNHVYTVLELKEDILKQKYVLLRNPWGREPSNYFNKKSMITYQKNNMKKIDRPA